MAYKAGELTGPFWAEDSGIANGRDPLGIQNSSVATYVKLLPGITNVTAHIRYYGFYCWLLEQYISNTELKNNNSLGEQLLFIRKAELLLAYIIKANGGERYNGVGGAAFVENDLKKNPHDSYSINLKKNAEFYGKTNTGVYWKLKSGVFGQYYIGVLKDLDLITEPIGANNIYVRTDKGKLLADAYNKNIPSGQRNNFLKAVIDGKISRQALSKLLSFHLSNIPFNSEEWKLYIDIMKGSDRPGIGQLGSTEFRKATIQFYLEFLKKTDDVDIRTYAYSQKINLQAGDYNASTGWYYYSLNEYTHLAYEHIFCSLLYVLELYPTDLKQTINDLAAAVVTSIIKELKLKDSKISLSELLSYCKRTTEILSDEMQANYRNKPLGCVANALLLLIGLYKENERNKETLAAYAGVNQILRKGNALDLFREIIVENNDKNIFEFVEAVIYQALNDHMYSSYNKAQLSQRDMFNILIEENTARRVRDMQPSFTSPRTNSLHNFLIDLSLVSANSKPINNAVKIFA